MSSAPLKEGDLLAGKYRVERVLGEGGMGVVVAAHHLALDEKVAIKMLLPDALENEEAVARFAREARAAVKIKNEHVARVIDVGTLDTGAPYMVMEYLEGSDLGDWVKQHGTLPVEQAVEFVLQACEAIAEAHGAGIVHRDIKSANLFVIRRADGLLSIKVLDFGISKITARGSMADMGYTKTRAVMGSPLYMSPEQMESTRDVDARTDIWALGVVLYELLTGNMPFLAESLPELVSRILKRPPEPMSTYRTDLPQGLEAVISKCLEKNREDRYPNVAKLAQALLPFGPKRVRQHVDRITRTIMNAGISESALALPPSGESVPPPAPAPADATSAAAPGRSTKASWGRTSGGSATPRMTAIYVAGAGALVAVLFFVLRTHPTEPAAEPTPLHVAPTAPSPAAAPPATPAEPTAAVTPVVSAAPSAQASAEPAVSATKPPPASMGVKPALRPVAKPVPPKPVEKAPIPSAQPKNRLYEDRK